MAYPRNNPFVTPPYQGFCGLFFALTAMLLVGCGSEGSTFQFDQIEQTKAEEQLVEVSLGEYSIPVSTAYLDEEKRPRYQTTMLLRFNLWALVTPREESHTKRLMRRNEGVLRDRVLMTCRNAPINDLQDPHLTALRSRLLDEVQPVFEGHMLRRVFMTDVLSDPM